jgi:hypothetical protein
MSRIRPYSFTSSVAHEWKVAAEFDAWTIISLLAAPNVANAGARTQGECRRKSLPCGRCVPEVALTPRAAIRRDNQDMACSGS